jgi:lipopolysaccharide transport system ATP-binding protein
MSANLNAAVRQRYPNLLTGRLPPLPAECDPALSPAVFHITHPKAGSQWVRRILGLCCPESVVYPDAVQSQFFVHPLRQGGVYPAVYATRQEFEEKQLPPRWRRFVVIRDLRDTLVSGYFSLKYSHLVTVPVVLDWRAQLQAVSTEEGLLRLLQDWLPLCASIQQSWLDAGERLIRYEDLLEHDLEILEPILLDDCRLPITPERLREVVLAARFESLTGGRARGQEDRSAHERKGVAGDWRYHFTPRVVERFKELHGHLLLALGYEHDWNW